MDRAHVLELFDQSPVVAAVKDEEGLVLSLESQACVVFILYGTVMSIPAIVKRVRHAGKTAIVHIDLIDGLSTREVAVDFIADFTEAEGIISTKPTLVKRAMEKGLLAIRRFFLLDSIALANVQRQLVPGSADLVELLPGVMPKMLAKIAKDSPLPLIAGGLISDKEDVVNALSAGAVAVSTTNAEVWGL